MPRSGRPTDAADAVATPPALALEGAPLFREADTDVGVYGVAQPTIIGVKTVLSVLRCVPLEVRGEHDRECVWVCTREEPVVYVGDRPYVLREAHKPTHSLNMSDRAENLEAIEKRLAEDILREASINDGLVLVHEEIEGTGELKGMWVAVQREDVRTVREVWASLRELGWRVTYHRLPIARNQPLEHNYLDAYTQLIKGVDPRTTCFVANCGAGVFRTTFAMIAAVLVRRKQLLLEAQCDPFEMKDSADQSLPSPEASPRAPTSMMRRSLRRVQTSMEQNHALLRLINVLSASLSTRDTQAAIEQLLLYPSLLKRLQEANHGEFGIIMQLCSLLDGGTACKDAVDVAIDVCAHVVNLRDSILAHRLSYSTAAAVDEQAMQDLLRRAGKALEVYYFLIAFASYVADSKTALFHYRFVDWLKHRVEIWRGIVRIRTLRHHLSLFEPIADLSLISRGDAGALAAPTETVRARFGEVAAQGAAVTGDEFAEFVVHNRSGTVLRSGLLLKRDVWREFAAHSDAQPVHGVVNFRRVPGTNIFGTGQPSVEGVHHSLAQVLAEMPGARTILWINLREEPLVYVSGRPYCLRQRELSLRNITDYSGITPDRLAQLEDRLRHDVTDELEAGAGKLLLHTETEDGTLVPLWEDAEAEDIATVQDVMDQAADTAQQAQLVFRRIPITAEKSFEFSDATDLLHNVLACYDASAPIIVNCQLGRGRTTLVSVLVLLIERWAESHRGTVLAPTEHAPPRPSYHVINSLLRVIPHGQEVKRVVDDAIDRCGRIVNIRTAIEEARSSAADTEGDRQQQYIVQGAQSLRRYFHLLVFQAFLQSMRPDNILAHTFEQFVRRQPVLETIERELDAPELATITQLRKMDVSDGMALSDEAEEVVRGRTGSVLSASTILKSDFFSGILKAGLPLRVEGMPNLRGVCPLVAPADGETPALDLPTAQETWGCGMPTIEGLRRGLRRMGASSQDSNRVVWTNLREEPVLYVNGRPHVLRLADAPLANVEATGVTTDVVERIECSLQRDLLEEARQRHGRVLLHDEVQNQDGNFTIVPVWETVREGDVLTPREVYERVRNEGFRVDYARVAVTDEQAPVPNVFSQLEERVQHAIETHSMTVFNCQMGRGRTTSGMVIAALIVTIDACGRELLAKKSALHTASLDAYVGDLREDELLLQGEYRCILQLVGVLSQGRLAKDLTDRVIDRMETIQNLRKAISLMKLRADNAELGSSRQRQLVTMFRHYLGRYGYLIAFAAYLLDRICATDDQLPTSEDTPQIPRLSRSRSRSLTSDGDGVVAVDLFPSFPAWLRERREITGILEREDLE